MKVIKYLIIVCIVFSLITFSFGGAVIKEFRINPGFNKVDLVWKMSLESNIKGYSRTVFSSFSNKILYKPFWCSEPGTPH